MWLGKSDIALLKQILDPCPFARNAEDICCEMETVEKLWSVLFSKETCETSPSHRRRRELLFDEYDLNKRRPVCRHAERIINLK